MKAISKIGVVLIVFNSVLFLGLLGLLTLLILDKDRSKNAELAIEKMRLSEEEHTALKKLELSLESLLQDHSPKDVDSIASTTYNDYLKEKLLAYQPPLNIEYSIKENPDGYVWKIRILGEAQMNLQLLRAMFEDDIIRSYNISDLAINQSSSGLDIALTITENSRKNKTATNEETKNQLSPEEDIAREIKKLYNTMPSLTALQNMFDKADLVQKLKITGAKPAQKPKPAATAEKKIPPQKTPQLQAATWLRYFGERTNNGAKEYILRDSEQDITLLLGPERSTSSDSENDYKFISINTTQLIFEYKNRMYYVTTK